MKTDCLKELIARVDARIEDIKATVKRLDTPFFEYPKKYSYYYDITKMTWNKLELVNSLAWQFKIKAKLENALKKLTNA